MDTTPATADLLIRNGRVLDPASGRDESADVLIRNGRVEAIEPRISAEGIRELDATDCLVAPGLVDPHVHLREPGGEAKETIASGTRAAVAGGFTTVCCMPNTTPALDSLHALDFVHLKAAESAACRVFVVAAATIGRLGEQIAPIDSLLRAGAVGISDDGDVVALCDRVDRVHVAGGPKEMGGHDGLGALGDCGLKGLWIEHVGAEPDVRKDRLGPGQRHHRGDGEVGHRRDNHLVALADSEGAEQEVEAISGAGHHHRVAGADVAGELLLKLGDHLVVWPLSQQIAR